MTWLPINWCMFLLHSHGSMSSSSSHTFKQFIRPMPLLSYTSKLNTEWVLKKSLKHWKGKGLNAMTTLSKFLVLLALFLLASHANVFTSLSLIAGNQVGVNYLIWDQQPMSIPTNEPSREPMGKPTKHIDLDAELLTNLSQKKSQVV